jgi:hypothetical protein
MQPNVVAHYVLAIMSQGSHISERYYKSQIPMSSHTLGCNHIRVNPTGRCTTTQLHGLARTARAATELSRNTERRESGASYSLGNTHRGARRRVTTAPVTKRWQTDRPARQFKLAQIKEHARSPPNSKESTLPRCTKQHSSCRHPVLPCRLPLRQPSLLLLLGWPPVRLVFKPLVSHL